MRKIMAVFAHPDDEGAIGGTLSMYANSDDTEVMLVCSTRGEAGEISDPTLATPETLGEVRTQELEEASRILGIQHLEWLDYRDSGMAGTPQNDDPRSLVQAPEANVVDKIYRLITDYHPNLVITFEPFGWYGHPDHVATGKHTTTAFKRAQHNGYDGVLYEAVIPISAFKAMFEAALESGHISEDEIGFLKNIPEEQQLATERLITHKIDISSLLDTKEVSRAAHRTQFGEDHLFSRIPREQMREMWGMEHFIQIHPAPATTTKDNPKADLFDLG